MWSLREEKVLESIGVFPECGLCRQYHLNLALDLSCIDIKAVLRDLYARSRGNGTFFSVDERLLLMVRTSVPF